MPAYLVYTPSLYDRRTFDTIDQGMAFVKENHTDRGWLAHHPDVDRPQSCVPFGHGYRTLSEHRR